MKSFTWFLIIIVLVVPHTKSFSQIFKPFPRGLGFEIGGGQNNFYWGSPAGILTPGTAPYDRTYFHFYPNVRLNYDLQLTNSFSAKFFTGYNQLGGRSDLNNDSQDEYLFDVIEGGAFIFYGISDLRFGLGFKINHLLNVDFKMINSESTYTYDRSDFFVKWSDDIGLRASYLFSPISISLEAWFGLSDLSNYQVIIRGGTIKENHYRLLVGYTL